MTPREIKVRISLFGELLKFKMSSCSSDLVADFLENPFSGLTYDKKVFFKNKRPLPDLKGLVLSGKYQNRSFNTDNYKKYLWLTGSQVHNKLYCWNCLLFTTDNSSCWGRLGYNDLKNLSRGLDRHEKSQEHITSSIKFKLTGKQNIINVVDSARTREIENHNHIVKDNREVLKKNH